MLAATLLEKKRDGQALSGEEIRFLIDGFCRGEVADYQMSAFTMAVCLKGMEPGEVTALTLAMLESGEVLPRLARGDRSNECARPRSDRPRVDKHSTGGLGDKVSLILAPLLACCGVDVPMISGRGLGLTGGTLDKLEAIEGFRTALSVDASSKVLQEVGAFIVGASDNVAPADRRLYALRDVTGTVESIPLITASVLSKKLAANLDALVMDVKVGGGAFMKTPDRAGQLADSIVRVGRQAGLPTSAIVSDMDQPLGSAVGNAIEVNEAVDVLRGSGPEEVGELTVQLGAKLLLEVGLVGDHQQACEKLRRTLDKGLAMEKFEQMIHAQGGTLRCPLQLAPTHEVIAHRSGYLRSLDCTAIGRAVVAMGGGRRRVDDSIDPSVGISLHVRVGDPIEQGQRILTAHYHSDADCNYLEVLENAAEIVADSVSPRPLILANR